MIAALVPDSFDFIKPVIQVGQFARALRLLSERVRTHRQVESEAEILLAELLLETGRVADAAERATTALKSKHIEPSQVSRARWVLALAAFYGGHIALCSEMLALAEATSEATSSAALRAHVQLSGFAIALNTQPIDAALTKLPEVKRAVMRAADAHLMVLLRIAVARAEGRRASPVEAQRHHQRALALLEPEPNSWLEGLVYTDMSAIAMLLGDLAASESHANKALSLAEHSGHLRTAIAARINMSQILTWTGKTDQARKAITEALNGSEENVHLTRSALDSLANLQIAAKDFEGCRSTFEQIGRMDASRQVGLMPHWDVTTEAYSRARLDFAEGNYSQAVRRFDHVFELATACGDQHWVRRARIGRAQCFGQMACPAEADGDIEALLAVEAKDAETLCRFQAALASVGIASGKTHRSTSHHLRAVRVAMCMANAALVSEIRSAVASQPTESPTEAPATDYTPLDSAVALLELSGHPHILAREAFAMLQDAGCTDGLALAARGPRGLRLLDSHAWTADAALAAMRQAADDELIVIGQHRDETWQILARPRPDLDHRCTLAAIRKLIGMARTLDRYRRDEKQRAALWPAESLDGDAESLWISEQSLEVLSIARRIASAPLPILITGETGTGKEMLARVIHRASDRAERPLHPFNCTAVPKDMLESQLFGYRKGAFTGAETAFPGVLRAAAGATLFLDEIGDVGLDVQPKLLRFIEHHEVHPLGEPHPTTVDVRIIAATNANLETLVAEGRFREDLLYRLNSLRLYIPPLRERREEIPLLAQHYIRKYADEQRKGRPTLSDETLEYLLLYNWPGNIRQLANEIRKMIALADVDATLTPALLSREILATRRTIPAATPAEPEISLRLDQPLPAAVEALEQSLIRRALERTNGRVEEAAQLLGISRKGLFLKRRRWGLRQQA